MKPTQRRVEPEWLDGLSATDPAAIRSRQDLRRINLLMGHVGLMAGGLEKQIGALSIHTVVELGAGDGTFLLRLAQRLPNAARSIKAVLVDRQEAVSAETREGFERLGWKVEVVIADVFDALASFRSPEGTAMIANLFLHHFQTEDLRRVLSQVASKAHLFSACEPRRSGIAFGASRLLGLIGCNRVTRHDAVVSVQAGFAGRELLNLWPDEPGWLLEERPGGLFSHVFVAERARV